MNANEERIINKGVVIKIYNDGLRESQFIICADKKHALDRLEEYYNGNRKEARSSYAYHYICTVKKLLSGEFNMLCTGRYTWGEYHSYDKEMKAYSKKKA